MRSLDHGGGAGRGKPLSMVRSMMHEMPTSRPPMNHDSLNDLMLNDDDFALLEAAEPRRVRQQTARIVTPQQHEMHGDVRALPEHASRPKVVVLRSNTLDHASAGSNHLPSSVQNGCSDNLHSDDVTGLDVLSAIALEQPQ